MAVAQGMRDRQGAARRSWAAVGIGEGAVASAGLFALVGVFRGYEWCAGSLGCSQEEPGVGAAALVLFAWAGALFVGGLCWSARVSGRPLRAAVARGVIGASAPAGVLLLVWGPIGAAGLAPALAAGTGAAAAIALREPAPSSRYLRLAAIAALALVAAVGDSFVSLLWLLLVFPAIGLADMVARGIEGGGER